MYRSAPKVRQTPARTFHRAALEEPGRPGEYELVYVKDGYHLEQCVGAAHDNPHIDNCATCLSGRWGWMLVKDTP